MDDDGFVERVPLAPTVRKATSASDALLLLVSSVVLVAWLIGHPILYSETNPVMSPFTGLSLIIMVLVRLARIYLDTWPMALSLAMTGLVLGGNLSSILMLVTMPPGMLQSLPHIVVTSIITSVGLILFCLHDLVVALRETPQSALILDDILIHLALVPGGLSLLGHLLENPGYLSIQTDPRVGISILEMGCMGLYAVGAVVSNPRLFLWQFLAAGWYNRFVFAGLFANQFIAPVVIALVFTPVPSEGPGIELFVMLGGVATTLTFLLVQARIQRTPTSQ